jgi:hypothetical protein
MRASPTLAGIQTAFNRKQVYDENCRRVSVQRWVGLVMFRLMFGGNPDSFWGAARRPSACRPGLVEVPCINEIVISAPQNLHRMFVKAVATNKQPRALWNLMAWPHAGGTLDKWGFDSMDRRVQYPHALNSWVLAEHQYKIKRPSRRFRYPVYLPNLSLSRGFILAPPTISINSSWTRPRVTPKTNGTIRRFA